MYPQQQQQQQQQQYPARLYKVIVPTAPYRAMVTVMCVPSLLLKTLEKHRNLTISREPQATQVMSEHAKLTSRIKTLKAPNKQTCQGP